MSKVFFDKINLNQISYQITTDHKLCNMVCGIGFHSSKFPCPYAECYKDPDGKWIVGPFRCVASLERDYGLSKGKNRNRLKEFNSVEFMPLGIKVTIK